MKPNSRKFLRQLKGKSAQLWEQNEANKLSASRVTWGFVLGYVAIFGQAPCVLAAAPWARSRKAAPRATAHTAWCSLTAGMQPCHCLLSSPLHLVLGFLEQAEKPLEKMNILQCFTRGTQTSAVLHHTAATAGSSSPLPWHQKEFLTFTQPMCTSGQHAALPASNSSALCHVDGLICYWTPSVMKCTLFWPCHTT